MKKKFLAFGLVTVMALSMIACGNTSDTKVIESNNSSQETAKASTKASTSFVFNYDGMDIPVDADVAPIIDKLGEPVSYFESPSCAAEGIGKLYTYKDFEIQTYPDGDIDRVLYVLLKTDNVATAEGINLSSLPEDVIAEYGQPTEQGTGSMKYVEDGMTLIFIYNESDNSLISIEYDSPMNK